MWQRKWEGRCLGGQLVEVTDSVALVKTKFCFEVVCCNCSGSKEGFLPFTIASLKSWSPELSQVNPGHLCSFLPLWNFQSTLWFRLLSFWSISIQECRDAALGSRGVRENTSVESPLLEFQPILFAVVLDAFRELQPFNCKMEALERFKSSRKTRVRYLWRLSMPPFGMAD